MQFIKQVLTDLGPPKECRQYLKPVRLPNIYEIDPTFFKSNNKTTTAGPSSRKMSVKKEKGAKVKG